MNRAPRPSLANVGSSSNARQSIAPGRQSIAPKNVRQSLAPAAAAGSRDSRGQSIGGRRSSVAPNRSGQFKDPREFKDPQFKKESMTKIIRYLLDHGYDKQITQQMLTSPTQKDFVYIISFLFKAAVPNFRFSENAKFEEEVPQLLKAMGYPSTLQKSSLTTIGAQHSWPPVLAALAWLVDLINYSEAASTAEETSFDEDGANKMFFDYLREGYALFLAGEDDLSPLEERIAFTFESKNAGLHQDIASLTKANEELDAQYKELTDADGKTPLQREQEHARALASDEAKFVRHIQTLNEHKAKVTEKLATESAESAARAAELEALLVEVAQHKATVAAQEMTPADVQQMHTKRAHLEGELASLQEKKDALSKQLWEEETAQARTIDRLEGKVQQANNCSLRLNLVPSHELRLNKEALEKSPEQLLSTDPKSGLLPALQKVKQGVGAEVASAQDELLDSERGVAAREVAAAERAEQLKELKADLAKLQEEEARLKEAHAKELADMKAETEALEEQIASRRAATSDTVRESQSELKALQKELDEFEAAAKRTREKIYSQLNSSLDMLLLHKDTVQASLASLKDHCDGKLAELDAQLGDDVDAPVDVQ